MSSSSLGKLYQDGDIIVKQNTVGNCMYVIQEGTAEVVLEKRGKAVSLARLKENDFFGEMALFEQELRSATVRAVGNVRVLTIDKKSFMRRISEDPSLAFRIVQTMSHRLRDLNAELAWARTEDRRQHARFAISTNVSLDNGEQQAEASLCDLSKSGARINAESSLAEGQAVSLHLPQLDTNVKATVVRKEDSQHYGLHFTFPLEEVLYMESISEP